MILSICFPIAQIMISNSKDKKTNRFCAENYLYGLHDKSDLLKNAMPVAKDVLKPVGCSHCKVIQIINKNILTETQYLSVLIKTIDKQTSSTQLKKINNATESSGVDNLDSAIGTVSADNTVQNVCSHNHITKIKQHLNNAKLIYLCGTTVSAIPIGVKTLLTLVESEKVVFQMANFPWKFSNKNELLQLLIGKSKVIIGMYEDFKYIKKQLYQLKYDSVKTMISEISRTGKVVIYVDMNKNIRCSFLNDKGRLTTIDYKKKHYNHSFVVDYVAAGFMSSYHRGDLRVDECFYTGCKWANEYEKQCLKKKGLFKRCSIQ